MTTEVFVALLVGGISLWLVGTVACWCEWVDRPSPSTARWFLLSIPFGFLFLPAFAVVLVVEQVRELLVDAKLQELLPHRKGPPELSQGQVSLMPENEPSDEPRD